MHDLAQHLADKLDEPPAPPSSSQPAVPGASNPCTLVQPQGNFKVAPGEQPYFQPQMASRLSTAIQNLNAQGITPTMSAGYRTQAMEDALRAAKAAGTQKNTVAEKLSPHQVGLAVD